jgi:hypothetical protein
MNDSNCVYYSVCYNHFFCLHFILNFSLEMKALMVGCLCRCCYVVILLLFLHTIYYSSIPSLVFCMYLELYIYMVTAVEV